MTQEKTPVRQITSVLVKPKSQQLGLGAWEEHVDARKAKRIGDCDPVDLDELFRWVLLKLGLRAQNWPTPEQTAILYTHAWQRYSDLTIAEVRLAFDLGITCKLDVDATCYENFSCQYLAMILESYRRWAARKYKEQVIALPPLLEDIPKEGMSDEEMDDWLATEIENIRKYNKPVEFVSELLYEHAVKRGMISPTKEEKDGAVEKAVPLLARRLEEDLLNNDSVETRKALARFRTMRSAGVFTGKSRDRLITLAKKLLFFELVQTDRL